MLLHSGPSLAEVPGLSPQQLESLRRRVEQRKQRLEADIGVYIERKQAELRRYETELVEHFGAMECATDDDRAESTTRSSPPSPSAHAAAASTFMSNVQAPSAFASLSAPAQANVTATAHMAEPSASEPAKRTKHSRVQKREKELFGLVTPIFLPLLEARDASPKKRREKRRPKEEHPHADLGSPSRDADKARAPDDSSSSSSSRDGIMGRHMHEGASPAAGKENDSEKTAHAQPERKKSKRLVATRKSSLRQENSPRPKRKSVSLAIDDQIVLPSDTIEVSPSPSDTTIPSVATTPSPTTDEPPQLQPPHPHDVSLPAPRQEPVHHSLPLATPLPSTSPTKHTGHALTDSPSSAEYDSAPSPQTVFLEDPFPSATHHHPAPPTAPVYANDLETLEEHESQQVEAQARSRSRSRSLSGSNSGSLRGGFADADFDTYVGGPSGSGVDNVNQSGSYGYPSSLGASYLESYMASRPLSVRVRAAEKAELEEREKRGLGLGGAEHDEEHGEAEEARRRGEEAERDEDMDVIGSMEGF